MIKKFLSVLFLGLAAFAVSCSESSDPTTEYITLVQDADVTIAVGEVEGATYTPTLADWNTEAEAKAKIAEVANAALSVTGIATIQTSDITLTTFDAAVASSSTGSTGAITFTLKPASGYSFEEGADGSVSIGSKTIPNS